MKCRKHPTRSAIAVCVACGRALCNRCTRETNAGELVCSLTCAARAREQAATLNRVSEGIDSLSRAQIHMLLVTGVLFMVLGGLVATIGLWPVTLFGALAAALFFGVAFHWMSLNRRAHGHPGSNVSLARQKAYK